MITGEEINALIKVRDVLKPLVQVTREGGSEKNVILSKCIPLISDLIKKIECLTPDTLIGRQLKKKKLSQEIEVKYGNIESIKLYACTTLVDPRYKRFAFRSTRESARAITNNYLDDAVSCSTFQADTDEAGRLPIQLREYLTYPAVNRKQNLNPFVV
ncbi:hypothetical protein KQX54_011177 [Cotesia glomerata]|uniref:Uncharacterized protein n=1 Tax=Cotesia glomerata TaxID=32391 RepID=A0AAV7IWC2_COTGL|nr:hypothetical protein KQX54_011177 [Cotesia glomerata]